MPTPSFGEKLDWAKIFYLIEEPIFVGVQQSKCVPERIVVITVVTLCVLLLNPVYELFLTHTAASVWGSGTVVTAGSPDKSGKETKLKFR